MGHPRSVVGIEKPEPEGCATRHTDAIADVEDRRLIIGIESETDDLPVGEARKLWAPDALKTKDVEIARFEELYRRQFLEACKRIAAGPRQ